MKCCLLIPDGLGIRNYLYTDLIPLLYQEGHEVVLWNGVAADLGALVRRRHGIEVEVRPFHIYAEPFAGKLWREAACFARLRMNASVTGNETLLDNWLPDKHSLSRRLLFEAIEAIGSGLRSENSIRRAEMRAADAWLATPAFKHYTQQLEAIAPDLLFCTHQRVAYAAPAVLAARQLGIPTANAIYSWDNLPKARLALHTDYYLVWSEHMRAEIATYHPGVEDGQVHVTGTPQFDSYLSKSGLITRDIFAAKHGLDPARNWVLFSGDDTRTSPGDPGYLKDLAVAMRSMRDVTLIFRPVPTEPVDRYQQVLQEHPEIMLLKPSWQLASNFKDCFPFPDDIEMLVNLVNHCSVVVNLGSTMALDFAHADKPALFMRYDPAGCGSWSAERLYRFQHFATMEGLEPVGWVKTPKDLVSLLQKAIDSPGQVGPDRHVWRNRVAGHYSVVAPVIAARLPLLTQQPSTFVQ